MAADPDRIVLVAGSLGPTGELLEPMGSMSTIACPALGQPLGLLGELAARLELEAVGANCGNNLADTEAAVEQIRAANPDVLVISKGNAGIPEWHGTELRYDGTPEVMAAYAHRAREIGATLIGVNQRDLTTFAVDQARALRVGSVFPPEVIRVAESGIGGPADAGPLAAAGYHAVLVGESLMTSGDPAGAVAALRAV